VAVIRGRGGRLWIWPSEDRWPYATTGPPVSHEAEWVTFEPEGLVVHVDSAIVPPERWVVSAVPARRWVVAKWNGLEPAVFGRLPLARPDDEPVEPPSSPLGHVRRFLVVPGLAWIFAVLWALHYLGVGNEWLGAGRWLLLSLLALVAFVAWLRQKLRERRGDNALESQRSPSRRA
jgi:hypothetical protein